MRKLAHGLRLSHSLDLSSCIFLFPVERGDASCASKRIMDDQLPAPTSRARSWAGRLNENVKERPEVWAAHRGLKLDPCWTATGSIENV